MNCSFLDPNVFFLLYIENVWQRVNSNLFLNDHMVST